jgi:hypothetical protein
MSNLKLKTSADLRAALLHTIEGVLEGRVNVAQANAVAKTAAQLHNSIRQDWDMAVYAAESLSYEQATLVADVMAEPKALEAQ